MTTNDSIKISGFNNGTTDFVNSTVNKFHSVNVLGPSTFEIQSDLSGEGATQVKTNTPAAYLLGLGSTILAASLQLSFVLSIKHHKFNNAFRRNNN